ncbi:hypothetical protein QTO01_11205 [Vibrio mytili]|uniref:DUF6950 family protein n=1 Tax=Vibrio mytili TaxID=50718 RepID=UPI002F3FD31B
MKALFEYLKSTRNQPWKRGVNDCCTLVAGAVMAQRGFDPMKEYRGYKTELGAIKALRKQGYESLHEAFSAKFKEVPKTLAKTGYIVLLSSKHNQNADKQINGYMGVKTPSGVWIIGEHGGGEIHPDINEILAVWEV